MSSIIDTDHLWNVCKVGQSAACCRYVVAGANGVRCAKHDKEMKTLIDERVAAKTFTARGDNCEGLADDTQH